MSVDPSELVTRQVKISFSASALGPVRQSTAATSGSHAAMCGFSCGPSATRLKSFLDVTKSSFMFPSLAVSVTGTVASDTFASQVNVAPTLGPRFGKPASSRFLG